MSHASLLSPEELARIVTPARLDLAIKARFARHLLGGGDPESERVYRWHIEARTGGRELRSWKASLDDYAAAARAVTASMAALSFDAASPIRICPADGRLMDGAHRLAIALVLGLQVYREVGDRPGRSRAWGAEELSRAGMAEADLARVKEDFEELQHAARGYRFFGAARA